MRQFFCLRSSLACVWDICTYLFKELRKQKLSKTVLNGELRASLRKKIYQKSYKSKTQNKAFVKYLTSTRQQNSFLGINQTIIYKYQKIENVDSIQRLEIRLLIPIPLYFEDSFFSGPMLIIFSSIVSGNWISTCNPIF